MSHIRICNMFLRMPAVVRIHVTHVLRMRTTVRIICNTWQSKCVPFAYNCIHMQYMAMIMCSVYVQLCVYVTHGNDNLLRLRTTAHM